jgi:hypothetical protein
LNLIFKRKLRVEIDRSIKNEWSYFKQYFITYLDDSVHYAVFPEVEKIPRSELKGNLKAVNFLNVCNFVCKIVCKIKENKFINLELSHD